MYCLIVMVALTAFPDGTLIFIEDGPFSRPIERVTGSSFSHVAIILNDAEGKPWVVEATPPKVGSTPAPDYLRYVSELQKSKYPSMAVKFLTPKVPFTQGELYSMKAYAASQFGRRYMARGYVVSREVSGIHCAQYVSEMLGKTGRFKSWEAKESPGSIFYKVLTTGLYE